MIARLGAGDTFGEMGIIDHAPRSLTAVAVEPSEVAVIDERTFLFLVQETPMFALQVMRVAGRAHPGARPAELTTPDTGRCATAGGMITGVTSTFAQGSVSDGPRPALVVDINCDVGESVGPLQRGDDEALMAHVSSASVACGFHAGDPSTMRTTCRMAAARGVTIGAHVGYRDLAGFGRRPIDVEPSRLLDEVVYQIGALQGIAAAEGTSVRYVKPHGALYNTAATDDVVAEAVAAAIAGIDAALPVVGLPGSRLLAAGARHGLRTVAEAFADRGYAADGSLVPRSHPQALLHDPGVVAARVVRIATHGVVRTVEGTDIAVAARTVCVHGDTPGAPAMAEAIRAALVQAGVAVEAFA